MIKKYAFIFFVLMVFSQTQISCACVNDTQIDIIANNTNTSPEIWRDVFENFCKVDTNINNSLENKTAENLLISESLKSNLTYRMDILNSSVNQQLLGTLDGWKAGMLNNTTALMNEIKLNLTNTIIDSNGNVIEQMDSITGRIRDEKVSFSLLKNITNTIELDTYRIVNANKTTTQSLFIVAVFSIITSVGIMLLIFKTDLIKTAKEGLPKYQNGKTKLSKNPSAIITDATIREKKKKLIKLKRKAIDLSNMDAAMLQHLVDAINEGMVNDEDELKKEHAEHLKEIKARKGGLFE